MRRLHPDKPGIRGLGVAESHSGDSEFSALAGVVMRGDWVVDGFAFGRMRVGGDDATCAIAEMAASLHRDDISYVMVWGTILSRYNLVDVEDVSLRLRVPVLGLSDRWRRDAEATICAKYPERLEKYRSMEPHTAIRLRTGIVVYARLAGCDKNEAELLLNRVTLQGRIPEPVRVARLLAGAARLSFGGGSAAVHIQHGSGDPS